jgi:type II secretory ATPase GspE/PulE/Tfp pilus assembly ATPase PilB-like protein
MELVVDAQGLVNGVDPAEDPLRFSAKRITLGEWLVVWGHATTAQVDLAEREARRKRMTLAESLRDLQFVDPRVIASYIAQRSGTEVADIRKLIVLPDVLDLIPRELALRHLALPLRVEEDGTVVVALGNALDVTHGDAIEQHLRRAVRFVTSTEGDVREAINRHYIQAGLLEKTVDEILSMDAAALAATSESDAPMVRLVDELLLHAISHGVSDIHIQPEERILRIRARKDGLLNEGLLVPKEIQNALTARIKILGGMDITETRLPQSGRYNFNAGSRPVDFRFSSLPTAFGESLVLRLLDRSSLQLELVSLGFDDEMQGKFLGLLNRPNGVILVTGPTGSGKTTTLYAALSKLPASERSIFTLEDPVEFNLPLVRQTQVNEKIGLTFASGLRTLLRQDPDIILVGETRDQETAELMVRAALTGHLVLSTLHTNDALGAIPRLVDLGVPSYLLPACLLGVLSQRLVRLLCPACRQPHPNAESILENLSIPVPADCTRELWKPGGCGRCNGSGYRGRVGIVEFLMLDQDYHQVITESNDPVKLLQVARDKGFVTMFQDGLRKCTQGLTTLEEVYRVTNVG